MPSVNIEVPKNGKICSFCTSCNAIVVATTHVYEMIGKTNYVGLRCERNHFIPLCCNAAFTSEADLFSKGKALRLK